MTIKNIENYRKEAKKLIDKGIINKYFEVSAKTNEGIDIFLKHLKIDSTIMMDKKISDPLNENLKENNKKKNTKENTEKQSISINKNTKENTEKKSTSIYKNTKENIAKKPKLFKYFNL